MAKPNVRKELETRGVLSMTIVLAHWARKVRCALDGTLDRLEEMCAFGPCGYVQSQRKAARDERGCEYS